MNTFLPICVLPILYGGRIYFTMYSIHLNYSYVASDVSRILRYLKEKTLPPCHDLFHFDPKSKEFLYPKCRIIDTTAQVGTNYISVGSSLNKKQANSLPLRRKEIIYLTTHSTHLIYG